MMREAQKMMNDPAFQERMKQVTENDAFKTSMEKTQEMMKDEDKVKELEETMKKRVEEGAKELDEFKKKSAELEAEEKKAAEDMKVSCCFGVNDGLYLSIYSFLLIVSSYPCSISLSQNFQPKNKTMKKKTSSKKKKKGKK
ncbi:hypothetical protein ACHAXR_003840 [Thalassiosira sp. AJA248-18]